ncbi:hypothetical protein [Cellulomonas sp. URHE0023]|uniref:hypothetical protein n=1 Tax=Cellulomonas sp. URHE0023 TaxID=1380354 RepID=UPI000691B395|nr:hypothetical protein [Cellulomonas sp. URHE0023]
MTEYTSSYAGTSDGGSTTNGGSTKTDTAKDQASRLKESATQSGGQLLEDAKSEAAAVSQEARRQVGDLWGQARSELSDQASTQQSRLAGGLTSVGSQLTQMASTQPDHNVATDVVHEVGQRIDTLGRWLDTHGPDELVEEVRDFARRRPVTFLALAAGAGIVLGRLTRGLKDAPDDASRTRPEAERFTPATTATPVTPVTTNGYGYVAEERSPLADDLTPPVPGTAGWDER